MTGSGDHRALIIAEDATLGNVVARQLRRAGFATSRVGSCAKATTQVRARAPELIVLDPALPDGDGLAMIPLWRQGAAAHTAIVTLGAQLELAHILDRALAQGADDVVGKPLRGEEFRARVVHAVQRRRAAATKVERQRLFGASETGDARREQGPPGERGAPNPRFQALFGAIGCGVIIWGPKSELLHTNALVRTLFRSDPYDESTPMRPEELPRFTREDESELPVSERPWVQATQTRLPVRGVTLGAEQPDGRRWWLHMDAVPEYGTYGEVTQVVTTIIDVTGRKLVERQLAAQLAVTRVLAEAPSVREAIAQVLQVMCTQFRWSIGSLWLVDRATDLLRCDHSWRPDAAAFPLFAWRTRNLTLALGDGLPGMVWSRGEPVALADVQATGVTIFPRAVEASSEGLRGAVGIPVRGGGDVLGVLEFCSQDVWPHNPDLVNALGAVGSQLGQFLERKRAESAVLESEAHKAVIFEATPDGVITMDQYGIITDVNPAAERTFGCHRSDALGRAVADLMVSPQLREQHRHGLARLFETGIGPITGRRIEMPAVRADGTEFVAELTITRIPIEGPPSYTGIVRDITKRRTEEEERTLLLKQERASRADAEAAQRRSAFLAEASALLDASLDYTLTFDGVVHLIVPELADWCVVALLTEPLPNEGPVRYQTAAFAHADAAKEQLLEELLGRYAARADPDQGVSQVLRTGRPLMQADIAPEDVDRAVPDTEDARLLREIGMRAVMSLPLTARGRVLGALTMAIGRPMPAYNAEFLLLAEDLARRIALAIDNAQLYQSAQEASLRYAAVLSGAPDAIVVAGEDNRIVNANEVATLLTGYAQRELMEMTPGDLVRLPPEEWAGTKALALGHPVTEERLLFRKDGSSISVEVRAAAIDLPDGKRTLVATIRDLTEREAIERNLASAEKLTALGQLAAGVAHDINNNLAAILGPAELAREAIVSGVASRDGLLADLRFIERAAQDAAQTVRRLQRFARHSQGEAPVIRQLVSPDDLLPDVLAFTRPRWRDEAQARGTQINVISQPGDAPTVLADPAELREALVNLVNNAADAMPTGGTLTVATRAATTPDGGRAAVLWVKDTGVGMDDATRRRLFEPFFTTKPVGKGTGLGLAMVHGIVRRLHGSIAVETGVGQGTTFTISLPAGEASEAAGQPSVAGAPAPLRLLVVEDEMALRQVLVRMLSLDGHAVTAVATAEEAQACFPPRDSALPSPFDVVLTDIGLPGASGWHLAHGVRSQFPAVAIVIASGWGASIGDDELAAIGLTRNHLVAKPYQVDDLRKVLALTQSERTSLTP
jgi:PAS domain S-box-containing protein